jgi:hypothetical protein
MLGAWPVVLGLGWAITDENQPIFVGREVKGCGLDATTPCQPIVAIALSRVGSCGSVLNPTSEFGLLRPRFQFQATSYWLGVARWCSACMVRRREATALIFFGSRVREGQVSCRWGLAVKLCP